MFLKLTSSGGHRYVRLVESFRNEDGQPRQRTVATLGRLDEQGGPLDALLGGLLRAKGHQRAGLVQLPATALRVSTRTGRCLGLGCSLA